MAYNKKHIWHSILFAFRIKERRQSRVRSMKMQWLKTTCKNYYKKFHEGEL